MSYPTQAKIYRDLDPHLVILMAMIEQARRDIASNGQYTASAEMFLHWCQHELAWFLEDVGAMGELMKGERKRRDRMFD